MSRFRMSHLLPLGLSLSVALPTLAAQAADPCTQLQSDAEAAVEAYIETHGDLPRSYEAILALEDPVRKLVMSRLPAEVHYQFWQQHFAVLAEVEMSDAQKAAILAVAEIATPEFFRRGLEEGAESVREETKKVMDLLQAVFSRDEAARIVFLPRLSQNPGAESSLFGLGGPCHCNDYWGGNECQGWPLWICDANALCTWSYIGCGPFGLDECNGSCCRNGSTCGVT